jgi:hypothetical protein
MSDFNERLMWAMKDKGTPKIVPLGAGMSGRELAGLQRRMEDPGLKAALGKYAKSFESGAAGIVGYATDEDAKSSNSWLRAFGLASDLDYPFIIYKVGEKALDKGGDVASQLWEKAIGSLWNSYD